MSEILKKQLSDAEAAGRRIAKQLFEVEKERDALAAKLKELEGQDGRIDYLLSTCHRLALELECLLLDTKDAAPVSRWWDSAMAALDGWHRAKDAASARPVPAEPVNARLVEAIKRLSFCAQTTGGTAGRDEELCAAIGEAEKVIADAESAPKAVRLTAEELDACKRISDAGHMENTSWSQRLARAIENAVLRKNGIEVAE